MKVRLIPRTILGQFVAGTVIVQAIVFAIFLSLGFNKQVSETTLRNQQRLRSQAEILASLSAEAFSKHDDAQLGMIYRTVNITTVLKGVRLTDSTGAVLQNSSNHIPAGLTAEERAMLPRLKVNSGYQLLSMGDQHAESVLPFAIAGDRTVILWMYPDAVVTLRNSRQVLEYALIYGVCALIGNLLLVWLLSSFIAKPLRALRRASLGVVLNPDDLTAFPLPVHTRNEAGELTESVNTMVSEIALQKQGIQETLALLDSMLHNAPIGFAFYDRECRHVRINENLARMHGFSVVEHQGKRLLHLFPQGSSVALADQMERWMTQVFRTGEPLFDCELKGLMPGDLRTGRADARTWMQSFFPVRTRGSGEVRWVGVVATEITDRLRAEEAMRRSEKLAAAGRLAASIAHEINNPLESVTNLLYLIREHPSLADDAKTYTSMAEQELARVTEITQQTLRFYRQSTLATDVRLFEVLQSVLSLHHGRLQSLRIDVIRKMDESAILFAFTGELRQLFANLVSNALDAMPQGGRLSLRLRSGHRDNNPGLWVTVADTGMGMPESVRRRIFEPFFTTKEATGTGLGLWVSEEILGKHHGTMRVRSREAVAPGARSGTVFRIFFPFNGVPRGPVIVRPARGLSEPSFSREMASATQPA